MILKHLQRNIFNDLFSPHDRKLEVVKYISTAFFKSNQIKHILEFFHNINFNNKCVIHLLECDLCDVGKNKTAFNIRLNNHKKR